MSLLSESSGLPSRRTAFSGPAFSKPFMRKRFASNSDYAAPRFARQVPVGLRTVGEGRLDLLVNECLVVELKGIERIAPIHVAQTLSYLKATRLRLGLLINFNVATLRSGIKRVIHSP